MQDHDDQSLRPVKLDHVQQPDPDRFVVIEIWVCLACADGDCHTCYGEECECRCKGEETAGLAQEVNR